VRRVLLRWVPLATLATVAVGLVLMLVPVDRELVLRIYALVLGGLAIATLSAATAFAARRTKSAFAAALRERPVRHGRPEELERLERQVALAVENAADFHFRLRPTIVAAADAAVWRSHGLQLDRAEAVLSPELWTIVEPEREPPLDRRAPGPPLAEIEAAVDEIERIRA
jgi:hypothetical protein